MQDHYTGSDGTIDKITSVAAPSHLLFVKIQALVKFLGNWWSIGNASVLCKKEDATDGFHQQRFEKIVNGIFLEKVKPFGNGKPICETI